MTISFYFDFASFVKLFPGSSSAIDFPKTEKEKCEGFSIHNSNLAKLLFGEFLRGGEQEEKV